jgi:membrane protease YdiL (CAAX protease family)
VRLVRHEGFRDAGLRLKGKEPTATRKVWPIYIIAYLAPLFLLVIGFVVAVLLHLQQWAMVDKVQSLLQLLPTGSGPKISATTLGLVLIVSACTVSIIEGMFATFGEELGWRGYLLPRLVPMGTVKAALLVGVIWGLWHAPLILFDGYEFGGLYPVLGVFFFLLTTIPYSIMLAWLRLRSGSIWPGVLAHATINSIAGTAVTYVLTSGNPYIAAPLGLVGLVPWFLFALWLVVTGRLNPKPLAAE